MSDRPEHQGPTGPAEQNAGEPILSAPAKWIEALQELQPARPGVPAAVDEAILAQSRAHLQAVQPARIIPLPGLLAMAAAFVLGIGLIFLLHREGSRPVTQARGDIDRNGQVDILDALPWRENSSKGRPERRVWI
jgi:hypothetical protein